MARATVAFTFFFFIKKTGEPENGFGPLPHLWAPLILFSASTLL